MPSFVEQFSKVTMYSLCHPKCQASNGREDYRHNLCAKGEIPPDSGYTLPSVVTTRNN